MFDIVKALKEAKYKGDFAKTNGGAGYIKTHDVKKRNGKDVHTLTVKYSDYTIIDDARDKMMRGCFDASIRQSEKSKRKIAFCWQHDIKDPIGKIVDFFDDEAGAYVTVELSDFDSVPNAKRAWSQSLDETINQASFGYQYDWNSVNYVQNEGDAKDGYFEVGNVYLHEISLVTQGCNQMTEVVSYEQGEKALIKSLLQRKEVQKAFLDLNDPYIMELFKEYNVQIEINKRGLFDRVKNV